MTIDTRVRVSNRKHERCIPETAYVAYRIGLPFFGQTGESPVIDLSQGGLLMRIPERVGWGKKAKLTITIPRFEEEICLTGIVRRCFESRKDRQMYAGIEFYNVALPLRAKLRAMCEYFDSPSYKQRRDEQKKNELWL